MVEYRRKENPDPDQELNDIFHALSDPSRRKIIQLLREAGEMTIGDIAEVFSMSLNGVSKHLKVLEAANLVERQVEGRKHLISVQWQTLQKPYQWLHYHHHFWSSRLDSLENLFNEQEKKNE